MIRRITLDQRIPPGDLLRLIDEHFHADFIDDKSTPGNSSSGATRNASRQLSA
jgi:hypothetical protein